MTGAGGRVREVGRSGKEDRALRGREAGGGAPVWPSLLCALWDLAAVIFEGQRMILKAEASDSPPGGGMAIRAESWECHGHPGLGRLGGVCHRASGQVWAGVGRWHVGRRFIRMQGDRWTLMSQSETFSVWFQIPQCNSQ